MSSRSRWPLLRHFRTTLIGCSLSACSVVEVSLEHDPAFPIERRTLTPRYGPADGQVATGAANGLALAQPIAFSHFRHATTLQMHCEYCHSEARRSPFAGVPPVQVCMDCHRWPMTNLTPTRKAEVAKIHQYYCGKQACVPTDTGATGTPIPWQKVHDLPDHVCFSHEAHLRGGVDCTECHGEVALLAQTPEGDLLPDTVMVRQTTLQMGWCLDCHATHATVVANYGEGAPLRRAELRDCLACHK